MQNTKNRILTKIKKARRGTLFFASDFQSIVDQKTASTILRRLVISGELQRVTTGIYTRPIKDKVMGILLPTADDIAIAIARRDRARIVPTGEYALYKLGLSMQMPMNIVYLTDGPARKVKLKNQTIVFKRTSPKKLSAIGEISKLVIQALRSIGEGNVTPEEINKINVLLKKEKQFHLKHDMKLAPMWIRKLLINNEGMK